MFGLETLDVLIGLVTIYLAFAVACTAIVEAASAWTRLRAKNLEAAMGELLKGEAADGETFVKAFYAHPLVQVLSKGDDGRPSYIPPELVSRVVESVLLAKAGVQDGEAVADRIRRAVNALPDQVHADDGGAPRPNRVKQLLTDLMHEAERAEGELSDSFRTAVGEQFDTTMERASGWFKRRVQLVTLIAAAALVLLNNVDTVAIATALSTSSEGRAELVKLAGEQVDKARELDKAANAEVTLPASGATDRLQDAEPPAAEATDPVAAAEKQTQAAAAALSQAVTALEVSGIPLGWVGDSIPENAEQWFAKVAGLLVSIFAVMLGAPFWFSVLESLNAVRSTGKVVPLPATEPAPDKGDTRG